MSDPSSGTARNPSPCSSLACTCHRPVTCDTGPWALTCPEAPIWAAWAWAACTAAAACCCCCWTSWALTLSMRTKTKVNIHTWVWYDTSVSTALTVLIKKGMETRPASQTKAFEVFFLWKQVPMFKKFGIVFPQTAHPIHQLLVTAYLYYQVLYTIIDIQLSGKPTNDQHFRRLYIHYICQCDNQDI